MKGSADLGALDDRGVSPLLLAARRPDCEEAVTWLMDQDGVEWDRPDLCGMTVSGIAPTSAA